MIIYSVQKQGRKFMQKIKLFGLLVSILVPCMMSGKVIDKKKTNAVDDKTTIYSQFLQGSYLQSKGNSVSAVNAFEHVMKIYPTEHIVEPYLQGLFETEQYAKLVETYEKNKKKIIARHSNNLMIKAYLGQAYLSIQQEAKGSALFQELMCSNGNDVQMCYFIAVGYLKANLVTKAIKVLQECIANPNLHDKRYLFHFLLSKAYLEANRPTEAMASIEESITQFPKFDRGWLFKAILFEQQGKINEAISGYKKFLSLSGPDQSIEKQLIQLLFSQERYDEAADYLKSLSADAPEYGFDLALVQSKSGNYDQALTSINKVLTQNPTLEKARLLKIEILLNSNKSDDAIQTLKTWLTEQPNNINILHTFQLLRQGGVSVAALIGGLESVHNANPTNITINAALGDFSLDANQPEKALYYYEKIIGQTTHKDLLSNVYFQRCYIMLTQKNYSALGSEIEKAEKEHCINDALLNLQACYYILINQQLDKALIAVDKALALQPDKPAYLDTKSRVLSAQDNYSQALLIAQKALSLAPDDEIIRQHVKELIQHAQQPSTSKTYTVRSRR